MARTPVESDASKNLSFSISMCLFSEQKKKGNSTYLHHGYPNKGIVELRLRHLVDCVSQYLSLLEQASCNGLETFWFDDREETLPGLNFQNSHVTRLPVP